MEGATRSHLDTDVESCNGFGFKGLCVQGSEIDRHNLNPGACIERVIPELSPHIMVVSPYTRKLIVT